MAEQLGDVALALDHMIFTLDEDETETLTGVRVDHRNSRMLGTWATRLVTVETDTGETWEIRVEATRTA